MNKVKMTQEQMNAVKLRKDLTKPWKLQEILFAASHGSHCLTEINGMTEEQITAAYYFPDHCEIEPEYEQLSNREAALAWADKHVIEFKSQKGAWYQFTNDHAPIMFQDKSRTFRRQKP
ncbi:hypothetical protein [Jeotgalibacillus haloalkalitolerans]|uniref:Uncharacterized protein n=1 Tax=Jeotgalibacillus haloalkalitolerans TaxID=3104292 RepID=A0ABU5KKF9_9BACL|nr:hypothetical protein [Jeotgalibacillus sp. HH7-29]MDZ5711614.1 hypothetical protein [Jeotgalibacillus sp. HH7-29]